MNTILVTGGAGFIGSHTVVELAKAGYRPIIIDNFSNSERFIIDRLTEITEQDIDLVEGDFGNKDVLDAIFSNQNISGVIHFAAYKAVGESVSEPLKYYHNNVSGFVTLLEYIEKYTVNNLVLSSSCTVYGEPDSIPVTEEAPTKPAESPYGATKQMDELILKDTTKASKNLRAVALRYFNPIGAHPSAKIGELPLGIPQCLVPFITQTAAGLREELTVFGNDYPTSDGTCIRDYIHVVDLAKAHIKALEHVTKQPKNYYSECNVGTGKGNSVLEVIHTFEKVNNIKVPYKIGPRRPGDVVTMFADASRSKQMLGWEAELTLEDALKDAWRWQESLK